jgi:hypothetical protein
MADAFSSHGSKTASHFPPLLMGWRVTVPRVKKSPLNRSNGPEVQKKEIAFLKSYFEREKIFV